MRCIEDLNREHLVSVKQLTSSETSYMDASDIHQRVLDTVVWCSIHANNEDLHGSLRSSELQPRHYDASREWGRYQWEQLVDERVKIVDTLSDRRASLVNQSNSDIPHVVRTLGEGRFIIYLPDDNLYDGGAEVYSHGYFDTDNAPPWDTWIAYVTEECQISGGGLKALDPTSNAYRSFLLAWVPPQFIEIAHLGIWANPEKCIQWAEDVSVKVVECLADLGLLRTHFQKSEY